MSKGARRRISGVARRVTHTGVGRTERCESLRLRSFAPRVFRLEPKLRSQ